MKDFFISRNSADREWAQWIASQLEAAGYSTVIQDWDFRPGANFVLEMHRASKDCKRTLIVLSQNFLEAEYTQAEWAAALAGDPQGEKRKLVPVRVRECQPDGLVSANQPRQNIRSTGRVWETFLGLSSIVHHTSPSPTPLSVRKAWPRPCDSSFAW